MAQCYVIAAVGSMRLLACRASLQLHGWDYTVFPAVAGTTVTTDCWTEIGIALSPHGKMSRRPGAQGCWMSHYQLWLETIKHGQPTVILEDDAIVTGPCPDLAQIEQHVIKLYTSAECKKHPVYGVWSKGAHAYALTPDHAEQLIAHAKQHGAQAVDKHLGTQVVPWRFYQQDLVTLNPARGPSTTSSTRYR